MPLRSRTLALLIVLVAALFPIRPAAAYSVLSHEEVVDMAWKTQLVPLLKARFPGISDDDLRLAHAYAYGGSVIQDIGYYPFGSHYFSDLLHYVRPNEFVEALLRDSTTPDEYAFALGALAHFCGDTVGHPFVNQVTALENQKLRERYGAEVTYANDPTAHVRTEFGFDVVMVAHGSTRRKITATSSAFRWPGRCSNAPSRRPTGFRWATSSSMKISRSTPIARQ